MGQMRRLRMATIVFLSTLVLAAFAVIIALHMTVEVRADTLNTFSGTLKDSTGKALSARVTLVSSGGSVSTSTAADGSFSIAANPGMYSLSISGGTSTGIFGSPLNGLYGYTLSQSTSSPTIDLASGSVAQDLVLPVATVNYVGYNSHWYPQNESSGWPIIKSTTLANPISLYAGDPGETSVNVTSGDSRTSSTSSSYFTSIVGVTYQPGDFCWRSASSSGWAGCNHSAYTVASSPSTLNFPDNPPATNSFLGTVKDQEGNPLGASITLMDAYNDSVKGTADGSGNFNVAVEPGVYRISSMTISKGGNPNLVANSTFSQTGAPSIDLTSSNVTKDISVPLATVNYYTSVYNPGYVNFTGTNSGVLYHLYAGSPGETLNSSSMGIYQATHGTGSFRAVVGTTYAPGSICELQIPTSANVKYCAVGGLTVGQGAYYIDIANVPNVTQLTIPTPTVTPSMSWAAVTYATKYFVYRDGAQIAETTGTTYIDSTAAVGSHVYSVIAADDTGVTSSINSATTKTVTVVAPSAPSTPSVTTSFSWNAVQGSVSYNVYRDGVLIGNTSQASYTDATPLTSTRSYYITALNGHGDEGLPSQTIQVAATTN